MEKSKLHEMNLEVFYKGERGGGKWGAIAVRKKTVTQKWAK